VREILGVDSVVFHTPRLEVVRAFYLEQVGLKIGTYEKGGRTVPDEDESYVNFDVGGVLLGFERGFTAETGTVVLKVDDLEAVLGRLAARGIQPERRDGPWAMIRDPEGRGIILQK